MKTSIAKTKLGVLAAILVASSPILLNSSLISATQAAEGVRVTTSFDHRHCAAVLRQVAKALSGGFDRAAAERLAGEIEALPADKRKSWDFEVNYQGGSHPLHVQALVDDLGMIDLDFTTDAGLAPVIRGAVDSYLNNK